MPNKQKYTTSSKHQNECIENKCRHLFQQDMQKKWTETKIIQSANKRKNHKRKKDHKPSSEIPYQR